MPFVRKLAVVVLGLLSTAVAAQHAACQCTPSVLIRMGVPGALDPGNEQRRAAALAVIGVKDNTGPVIDCPPAAGCPTINVRVVQDGEQCEAWLDYCALCVRKKHALIRFRLTDGHGTPLKKSDGYSFSHPSPRGIEIAGAAPSGREHFKTPVRDADLVRYTWMAGKDNTPKGLDHEANVIDKYGKSCLPKDPLIVNVAN